MNVNVAGRIFKALKTRKSRNTNNVFGRKSDQNASTSNNKNLFTGDNNRFVVIQVCKILNFIHLTDQVSVASITYSNIFWFANVEKISALKPWVVLNHHKHVYYIGILYIVSICMYLIF